MNDAGRIVPLPKGNYDATVQYEFLDMVFDEATNATYIAKKNTIGNAPALAGTEYWQLVCAGAVVDTILSSTSYNPVANAILKAAIDEKVDSDGNISAGTVDTFTSSSVTFPVPSAGETLRVLWGKVAKWFSDARSTFLAVNGNAENTTVDSFDTVGSSFPTPTAGESQNLLWGKVSRWFSDAISNFVKKSDIVNSFTQTEEGSKALDAVAGKTLNDTIQAAIDTLIHGSAGSIVGGFKTIAYDASAVDSVGSGAAENYIMHCRTGGASDSLSNAFRDAWTSTTPILTLNNVYWTMLSYAYGGSVRFQFAFTHAAETPMFAFRAFAWWGSVTWSNWQVVGAPDGAKQTVTTTSTATDLSNLTTAQLQQIVFNSDNATSVGSTNQILIYPLAKMARVRIVFELATVTTGGWRQVCRLPIRPKQTLYFSVIAGSVGELSSNYKMDANISSNGIMSIYWGATANGKRVYMADLVPLG